MRVLEPQTRFLVRGSALLIGLLTIWWFTLLGPMLYLVKSVAGAFISIEETAAGDWSIRVPLEKIRPATPQHPIAQQVRSIDFDLPRSDAITFTFSLPVYWAIILAAPGGKSPLRPLLWGTAVVSAIEVALFLIFAQIAALNAASRFVGIDDSGGKWIRQLGEYLAINVLPFAVPSVAALSIHRELRWEVLRIGEPTLQTTVLGRAERRRRAKLGRASQGR